MSPPLQLQRLVECVPEDPLKFWLSRLDSDTVAAHRSHLLRFLRWLRKQPGWETTTPREMLVRHLQAADNYILLDLLQAYIGSLVLRKSSKRKAYSVVRSFFAHNRCGLPTDPSFRIKGDRPPVQAKLTVQDVVEIYHAATLRYKSIILFKWQSFLDNARLIYANVHCADEIVRQIQMDIHPVRFELPGRKENENDPEGQFCTFIGKDAVDALVRYFEEERGWPRKGEPLWIQSNHKPLTKPTFESTWLRLFRHVGKIPKRKGPLGSRYGFNPHEMRDVATSFLHTNAKADGFDMDCAKLWCGQVGEIDPLKYDKFYKDQDYLHSQYQIAERYLNVITGKPQELKALSKENEELRERISRLEGKWEKAFEKKITDTT